VLIVDDHHETRENIYSMVKFFADLEAVGHAGTGIQALDMAYLLKPDVILMDVGMPGIDGVAISQTIRRALPEAKIVMMSVQDNDDYKWGSMLVGASHFLTKPFSSQEMVACIRAAVAQGE
jgi:DNA-binding NarL/FixJ family response regulator